MTIKNKLFIPFVAFISFNAHAKDGCEYSMELNTTFKGTINSVKILKQQSFPYIDGTKKCVVKLEAKVKDKWFTSQASYIYESDMSERDACIKAEYKAKENILYKYIPEILNRKVKQNCRVSMGVKSKETNNLSKYNPKVPPYKCIISINWIPINIGNKSVMGYKEICK